MALLLQYKKELMQWAVWKMDESIEELLAFLPELRRISCEQELKRFTSEHRRKEWLSVRVLLYTILQEDKLISYTSEGKPFLADHSAYISISHTKGYVALALSKFAPLGIDIEQYSKRVHRVYDRFIRPDEQIQSYQGDTTWSMLLHWSAKETLYKCLENPDADFRNLRLFSFIPQQEGTFQAQDCAKEEPQSVTIHYRIFPDFVLTWTMRSLS